jgi:hypothetical protein
MKKILLTLAFLLAVLPALFAQDGRSIVRVRLSDNTPLRIAIDGKAYNDEGKVVTVDNITAGRHKLKVFVPAKSGRGNRTLVYQGDFKVEPGTYSYFVVDRYKGTVRVSTGYRSNLDRDVKDPIDRGRYPNDKDRGYNDRTDQDRYDRGDDRHDRRRNALTSSDMDDLQVRVSGRMHNDGKVHLMKSVLQDHTYTTAQVRTMLSWLSFDDSKLQLAKIAYANVVDKKNYWKLEDSFSFSSTREDFSEYLTARR